MLSKMDDDECYEFVKYFVLGAKEEFEKLTRPSILGEGLQLVNPPIPKPKAELAWSNFFLGSLKVACIVLQEVDKWGQENIRQNAETLVDSVSPTSEQRDEIFIQIFIRPALEIFKRCKNQFKLVRRTDLSSYFTRSIPTNESRKKAVETLAKFIGGQCFELMLSQKRTIELEQVLSNIRDTKGWSSQKLKISAAWHQLRRDQLCYHFKSGEKFNISKYHFFARLLPAFSTPTIGILTSNLDQNGNAGNSDNTMVVYLHPSDYKNFPTSPWKSRLVYLRPPINFEFSTRKMESESEPIENRPIYEQLTIEKVELKKILPHSEIFSRGEGDDITDDEIKVLHKKLKNDRSFDHQMANWSRLEEITKDLKEIKDTVNDTHDLVANQSSQIEQVPEKTADLVVDKLCLQFQEINLGNSPIYATKCPVDDPTPLFVGRDDLVQKIREVFETFESRPRVERNHLQNIAVIAGLGGMGKSEVCRQFVKFSFDQYGTKCFWIECESPEKTRACILGLAMDFVIAPFNQLQPPEKNKQIAASITTPKEVGKVAQSVYDHLANDNDALNLKGHKTLFIFDNVDNITQDQNFVTSLLIPQSTRFKHQPDILITSQHWERSSWPTGLGAILNIPVFTLNDTLSYFRKKFGLAQNNVTFDPEVRDLYDKVLQGFPLATVLAFAYIKKVDREGPTVEGIQKYRKLFDNCSKDWVTVEGDADLKVKYDKIMANVWDKTLDHLNTVCPAALDLLNKLALTNFYDFQLVQGYVQLLGGESETVNSGAVSQIDYLEDYFLISKKRSFVSAHLSIDSPPYPYQRNTGCSRGSIGDYYLKKIGLHEFVARVTVAKLNEREAAPDVCFRLAKTVRDILKGGKTDLDISNQTVYMFLNLIQGKKPFVDRSYWIGENISAILSFTLAKPLYPDLSVTTYHVSIILNHLRHYFAVACQDPRPEETEEDMAEWERKIRRAERELETIQVYWLFHTLLGEKGEIEKIESKGMKKKLVLKPMDFLFKDQLFGQEPEEVVDEQIREISCESAIAWIWTAMTKKCDDPSWSDNMIDLGIQFLSWCDLLDIFANDLDDTSFTWIKSYQGELDWHLLLSFWIRSCGNSPDKETRKRLGAVIALFFQRLKDQLGKKTTPLPYGLLKSIENLCQDKVVGKTFRDKLVHAESHLRPEDFSISAQLFGRCTLSGVEYTHEIQRVVSHIFGILSTITVDHDEGRKLLLQKNPQFCRVLQSFLSEWVKSYHFSRLELETTVHIFRQYFDFIATLLSNSGQNFAHLFWTREFSDSLKTAVACLKKCPNLRTAFFFSGFYWIVFAGSKSASESNLLGQFLLSIREELCSFLQDPGLSNGNLSGYLRNFYNTELGQKKVWKNRLDEFICETQDGGEAMRPACQLASLILESLKAPSVEPSPPTDINEDKSVYAECVVPLFKFFEDTELLEGVQVVYTNAKGERIWRN